MRFYTSVFQRWDTIYVRGYCNGKRFNEEVKFEPYVFESDKNGAYRTIHGQPVEKLQFGSMRQIRAYTKQFEGVAGKTIYGLTNYPYLYIYDEFPGQIDYDASLISVVTIDIEVRADEGFPSIELADKEITAVTLRKNGKSLTLGCGVYREKSDEVTYVFCRSEEDLLENFIRAWKYLDPDVVTGWNIEPFDVPYVVHRIKRVLGEHRAKELSPWGILEEREFEDRGRWVKAYVPEGVTVLDYIRIYKKFSHKNQESYSLNNIASVELGEKKLDYSDYDSLLDLYERDYERFIDYNIHDTLLVDKLEAKLGFIHLVFSLAYTCKVCYIDTLATVRPWDCLVHSYLMDQRIVVEPMRQHHDYGDLIGGYVKEAKIGKHEWVVSFDLNSLYMHLAMHYNISPDTFVDRLDSKIHTEDVLSGALCPADRLREADVSMTANGCLFKRDKQGFIPAIATKLYEDRRVYKKKMLEHKQRFKLTGDVEEGRQYSRYNNLQDAMKVLLNSGYGAIANEYFRWYSFNMAEAITSSGQLSIRWIERDMNAFMNEQLDTDGVDYIVASDTDSIYVDMSGFVSRLTSKRIELGATAEVSPDAVVTVLDSFCDTTVQPMIEKSFQNLADTMNAYMQKMQMKRENICSAAIWKAAKNYVLHVWDSEGVRYKEPEVKIVGIEAVRSSTPQVCRDWIREALKIMLAGNEHDLQRFVGDKLAEFKRLPFDRVAFPKSVKFRYPASLKRTAGTYTLSTPGLPIAVRAALLFNDLLKRVPVTRAQPINSGDKIKFCYMRVPNPLGENVVGAPGMLPHEFDLDRYIDYDLQFEKAFVIPVKRVAEAAGWTTDEVATLEGLI